MTVRTSTEMEINIPLVNNNMFSVVWRIKLFMMVQWVRYELFTGKGREIILRSRLTNKVQRMWTAKTMLLLKELLQMMNITKMMDYMLKNSSREFILPFRTKCISFAVIYVQSWSIFVFFLWINRINMFFVVIINWWQLENNFFVGTTCPVLFMKYFLHFALNIFILNIYIGINIIPRIHKGFIQ